MFLCVTHTEQIQKALRAPCIKFMYKINEIFCWEIIQCNEFSLVSEIEPYGILQPAYFEGFTFLCCIVLYFTSTLLAIGVSID